MVLTLKELQFPNWAAGLGNSQACIRFSESGYWLGSIASRLDASKYILSQLNLPHANDSIRMLPVIYQYYL
ncbi:hypothetical protein CapIbe_003259 [Capra ibex]